MNPRGITIERASFDSPDAAALRAELVAELEARYGRDTEPGAKPSAEDTRIFLLARNAAGEALACGGIRSMDARTVEIKRMFVRPAARGLGLGRTLLAALEAEAAALGATRILLETGPLQPDAIRLYERGGYRRIPCFGPYAGEPMSVCFERRP